MKIEIVIKFTVDLFTGVTLRTIKTSDHYPIVSEKSGLGGK